MNKNQLQTRLEELRIEYQKGQERLTALEQETASVKNSMLRISGAIQVLEELLHQPINNKEKAEINEGGVEHTSLES